MADFHEQTFEHKEIVVDGNAYLGCTFIDCVISYSGGGTGRFSANRFTRCEWRFKGPAWTTLKYLRWLYNGGGDFPHDVATRLIEFIQKPLADPTKGEDDYRPQIRSSDWE